MRDRTVNDIEYTVKYRELNEHRQTRTHRVTVFLCVKLHYFFVVFFLIFAVLLFELVKLWLERLHYDRGFLRLDLRRYHYKLCNDREKYDRKRIIVADMIEKPHYPTERITDDSADYAHFNLQNSNKRFLYIKYTK